MKAVSKVVWKAALTAVERVVTLAVEKVWRRVDSTAAIQYKMWIAN